MARKHVELANGIELYTVDIGPKNAPAIIFLHGFPENHRTWRHQIEHFRDRYRCIAPDQRGYRGSSKPEGVENYTADKLIGDVFLLADALGVDRFTIAGHDWGGAIAWGVAIAGQDNGRVEGTVIANAPHPAVFQELLYTNEHQRRSSQYIAAFRNPANDALVEEHGLAGILLKHVKWDSDDRMEPEERAALLKDWQDREAAMAMLNWYRASPIDVPSPDAPYALPEGWSPPPSWQLKTPTLVMWGMDDLALPPENLGRLDEFVDDLTVERIEGCGHFTPWEAPEAVNGAMERFFDK